MIRAPRPACPRHGISLLEVLVALAIFVMSIVALGQIIQLAANEAMDIEMQARAVQLCKSKLDEVAAGAVELQSQEDAPFDEDPDWVWSLDCEQKSNINGLWQVRVTVRRASPGRSKVEYSLSQLVFDPSQRGSNLDAAQSSSSSSSGSGASSSGGQNNAAGAGGAPAANQGGGP
jgi:type II secretion system protein I